MTIDRARLPADIVLAAHRLRGYVRETPLDYSPFYSDVGGANVYLKLENLQHTASFKLRGAFNKLLALTPEQKKSGGVAASSGNHGAAIAHAMQKLGIEGVIFVPEKTASTKVDAIRLAGAEVRFFGTDGLDTETHARAYAEEHGMVYLSPYNDVDVIVGQGTCGFEIAKQLSRVDAAFIAVGGGGLISGVGAFLKSVNPDCEIYACQPQASPVMTESVKAGKIVDMPSEPTLSDGTAGGIEAGAITFDLCREIADDYLLVSEEDIGVAMRGFIDAHHMLLEGAAGVAIAGYLQAMDALEGRNVVIVVCGGNISRETLKKIL